MEFMVNAQGTAQGDEGSSHHDKGVKVGCKGVRVKY